MKTTARPFSRGLWLLAACGGAVIAWTALSFSMSSTSAHAQERPAGLLDDLSSLVDSTTSAVTSTTGQLVDGVVNEVVVPVVETVIPVVPAVTEPVVQAVPQVIDPVVEVVASVPVVGPEAAHLVSDTVNGVTETVGSTVDSATELLGSDPLAAVTKPLRGNLDKVPVVGGLLDVVDPVFDPLLGGADQVLGTVGNTVETVVDPVTGIVITPPPGTVPGVPGAPGSGDGPGDSDDPGTLTPGHSTVPEHDAAAAGANDNSLAQAPAASRMMSSNLGSNAVESSAAAMVTSPTQGTTVPASDATTGTPAAPAPTQTSSAGAGGGSAGTLAAIVDTDPQQLGAAAAHAGAVDDEIPAAPVFDTDISPD